MGLLQRYGKGSVITDDEKIKYILINIKNILNSSQEYSSFMPYFGMTDVSSYTSREDILRVVSEDIRRNIERFEPEIDVISITEKNAEEQSRLNLTLECFLRDEPRKIHLVTELTNKLWSASL